MTLEYHDGVREQRPVLTVCPACGYEFTKGSGIERREHIGSHDPEDFGL